MANNNNLNLVSEKLKSSFGETILSSEMLYDYLTFEVKREKILDIVQFLFNDEQLRFRFLTTLCGMHFPHLEKEKQFGVVYHLHCLETNTRIRLKVFLNGDKPEVLTMTPVFEAANWMERETFDFYGINFIGHPNLKRILNMDDITFFPMRKDFPLEDQTREDKDDRMFGR